MVASLEEASTHGLLQEGASTLGRLAVQLLGLYAKTLLENYYRQGAISRKIGMLKHFLMKKEPVLVARFLKPFLVAPRRKYRIGIFGHRAAKAGKKSWR